MEDHNRIRRGWHFLQIPGPSNTPERVREAMARPTLDHRGPEFAILTLEILKRLKRVFKTEGDVIIYPSSGTGAWEAALMNLLDPGDRVLAFETGHFAMLWKQLAERIGIRVDWIESDWRRGVDPEWVKSALASDRNEEIKAVMVVHNETSTGVTTDLKAIRQAIDEIGHPALFLVDAVSSLLTTDFRQDEWGVDVTISASQKGMMLPPGLSFNSVNRKAIQCSSKSNSLQSYWQWERIIEMNSRGFYPYTPASSLFQGLEVSLEMVFEEGLANLFNRHRELAYACRKAADSWGLENQAINSAEFSDSTTALRLAEGFDSDSLRKIILENYDLSLGKGLGRLESKVFRIGHLGDINELMLLAALAGVEMGLNKMNIPIIDSGVKAAIEYFSNSHRNN